MPVAQTEKNPSVFDTLVKNINDGYATFKKGIAANRPSTQHLALAKVKAKRLTPEYKANVEKNTKLFNQMLEKALAEKAIVDANAVKVKAAKMAAQKSVTRDDLAMKSVVVDMVKLKQEMMQAKRAKKERDDLIEATRKANARALIVLPPEKRATVVNPPIRKTGLLIGMTVFFIAATVAACFIPLAPIAVIALVFSIGIVSAIIGAFVGFGIEKLIRKAFDKASKPKPAPVTTTNIHKRLGLEHDNQYDPIQRKAEMEALNAARKVAEAAKIAAQAAKNAEEKAEAKLAKANNEAYVPSYMRMD